MQHQIAQEYERLKSVLNTLQLFKVDAQIDRPIGGLLIIRHIDFFLYEKVLLSAEKYSMDLKTELISCH